MIKILPLGLLLTLLLSTSATVWAAEAGLEANASVAAKNVKLGVTEARVRLPIGQQTVTAGYLTIANDSDVADELVSVTSEQFARIELHAHEHANGMMKMRQLDSLPIPAGQTQVFSRGGMHLMLFDPQPMVQGQTVPLTLHFRSGLTLQVDAVVIGL